MFEIYSLLGGKDQAIAVISRALGEPVQEPRQRKWETNGRLPGSIALILMAECDRRRIRYQASDFVAGYLAEPAGQAAQ